MSNPNINVVVSGPKKDYTSTYKTYILRGNMSFADQVTEPNIKYVVKYDFDLGGESVTIPANCVLAFDGGSLSNGSLVGNNTSFEGMPRFNNVVFSGDFIQKQIYTGWFNYYDTSDQKLFDAVEAICNSSVENEVFFSNRDYTLNVSDKTQDDQYKDYGMVLKSNTILHLAGTITINTNSLHSFGAFLAINVSNIVIEGDCTIIGDRDTHNYDSESAEYGAGIKILGCNNVKIHGLYINKWTGDAIDIGKRTNFSENITIDSITGSNCGRCGIGLAGANYVTIQNSRFVNIGQGEHAFSVYSGIDIEPNSGEDGSGNHIRVINCEASGCKVSYKVDHTHIESAEDVEIINCIADTKSALSGAKCKFVNCTLPVLLTCRNSNADFIDCTLGLLQFINGNYNFKSCTFNEAYTTSDAIAINRSALINNGSDESLNVVYDNCSIITQSIVNITQRKRDDFSVNANDIMLFTGCVFDVPRIVINQGDFVGCTFRTTEVNLSNISHKMMNIVNNRFLFSVVTANANNLIFLREIEESIVAFNVLGNSFVRNDANRIRMRVDYQGASGIYWIANTMNVTNEAVYDVYRSTLQSGFSSSSIILFNDLIRANKLIDSTSVSLTSNDKGVTMYHTTFKQPVWWDGTQLRDADGNIPGNKSGASTDRPISVSPGFMFFDTSLSPKKPIWWNGTAWADATGVVAETPISGTFANKPTVSANNIPIGFKYFCTDKQTTEGATDGIEIIHKGNNVWVDALGRVVS